MGFSTVLIGLLLIMVKIIPDPGMSYNITSNNSSFPVYLPGMSNLTISSQFNESSFPIYLPVSGSCAAPELCCPLENDSCNNNGCFCDVACLRFHDCCPDFISTCVTGMSYNTTNTTNNPSSFPTYLPGSCKAAPALCCGGYNLSCFRGCFCDEACVSFGDCCSDYNSTCKGLPDVLIVNVRLRASLDKPEEAVLYTASQALGEILKNYSDVFSLLILKIKKT
ncbi:uncharacterized protein LOC118240693 [Electrophorus electricus]|nr:uncharacterized protein LOC118240693 [Electrophorus electricus]